MANISTVYGDYTFDFKNTDTNSQEQLIWLIELSKFLANNVECKTDFFALKTLISLNLIPKEDMAILKFSGSGYQTYENNVKWFESDKNLKAHLLKMRGLRIDISFAEYEESEGFVARGCYILKVFDESVVITQTYKACDKFNKENFIGWEFGSEEDWNKQFGDKEAKTKKTGLYQVIINYAYRDPESEWWVEPSDTYCAFTSAEKAKEFAIEKIKREWSHLVQISELEFVEQNPEKDSDEFESVSIVIKEILILDIT